MNPQDNQNRYYGGAPNGPNNTQGPQSPLQPRPNQYQRPNMGYPIGEPTPQSGPPQKSKWQEIKSVFYTISLFVLAPLFAIFMIIFVFQSYIVDGSSMEPTLHNGNRVFILKLPKSIAEIQGKTYIPTRNEVIVFKKPGELDTQLIKRVIGLPGERVVIKDGGVIVYNTEHPEGFDPSKGTDYEGTLDPTDTEGNIYDTTVGDNEVYVLGDNRAPGGSYDSRYMGPISSDVIVGRLWLRYFPISQFTSYANLVPALPQAFFAESLKAL